MYIIKASEYYSWLEEWAEENATCSSYDAREIAIRLTELSKKTEHVPWSVAVPYESWKKCIHEPIDILQITTPWGAIQLFVAREWEPVGEMRVALYDDMEHKPHIFDDSNTRISSIAVDIEAIQSDELPLLSELGKD